MGDALYMPDPEHQAQAQKEPQSTARTAAATDGLRLALRLGFSVEEVAELARLYPELGGAPRRDAARNR